MGQISLPESTAPGPTKPAVRALVLWQLALLPSDHVLDVGAGTGAVTIEAAQIADRVTAIERDRERAEAIRTNAAASGTAESVTVVNETAPDGLPESADAVFIGGTQNLTGVLEWVANTAPRTVVLNAVRLETTVRAIESFEEHGFDPELRRIAVDRGTELAGETAFEPERPIYLLSATPGGKR